jgi:hypothetical protein
MIAWSPPGERSTRSMRPTRPGAVAELRGRPRIVAAAERDLEQIATRRERAARVGGVVEVADEVGLEPRTAARRRWG